MKELKLLKFKCLKDSKISNEWILQILWELKKSLRIWKTFKKSENLGKSLKSEKSKSMKFWNNT